MGIDFYYWGRIWDLLQALPYWEQATFPKGMCASSVCQGELLFSNTVCLIFFVCE